MRMSDGQALAVLVPATAVMLLGVLLIGVDAGAWQVIVVALGACNAAFAAGRAWERRSR